LTELKTDLLTLKNFVFLGNEYESYASDSVEYYPKGGIIYNKHIVWDGILVNTYTQEQILAYAGDGTDEYSGISDFSAKCGHIKPRTTG
jgi:hypothetical protein